MVRLSKGLHSLGALVLPILSVCFMSALGLAALKNDADDSGDDNDDESWLADRSSAAASPPMWNILPAFLCKQLCTL